MSSEVIMEITKKQLDDSINLNEDRKLSQQLETIYSSIPGGQCDGCAKCCTESVHTFFVEFIQIYKYLVDNNLYEEMMKKIEQHYFSELTDAQDCPFLNQQKQCVIYPVRPLVCRLFGYATRDEHESNYERVFEMNKSADDYFFEEMGVHLGESVMQHKIEYCESFVPGRSITLEERNEMIDKMFQMDSMFLMEDLIPEDAINMSLTNWFIYLRYDEEDASEKRIKHLLASKNMG